MKTLFQQIELHALSHPARPAVMLTDRVITFAMVQSGVDSVRHVLAQHRLEPDTCVGVLIDNPARHLIVALALIANGHAAASLRPDLLAAGVAAGVTNLITDTPLPITPGVKPLFADDKWFALADAPRRPLPVDQPERIIRVFFTSGSTGRPKAIAITQRAMMALVFDSFAVGTSKHERTMTAFGMSGPAFHQALQTLSSGRTLCFAPPSDAVQLMSYCNVDEWRGTVGQVRAMMERHEAMDRPLSLKQITIGGAFLPPDLADALRSSFGCELITPYATAESGLIGSASGALLAKRRERGNCYSLLCEVEIVSDTDEILPKGTEGLIRVRSPSICRPFTGALVEEDGANDMWHYPGDRGRIDPDGLLIVTGRNDEVINIGGGKIDPEVLENLVRDHPAIEEIAALRMTDDAGLEQAWAVAKVRHPLTLEDLNKWLGARIKGEMRGVRFARLEIVDDIPRTHTAKIARGALRKRLIN
jgi:acyl-coenzyme A synthetase/AMP-(fatty) acid ligase